MLYLIFSSYLVAFRSEIFQNIFLSLVSSKLPRIVGGIIVTWGIEVLGEDLSHCHFTHYKSHMDWRSIEPAPLRCEAAKFYHIVRN